MRHWSQPRRTPWGLPDSVAAAIAGILVGENLARSGEHEPPGTGREPFPDLWERLIGGDWWERIEEERARRYFDAEAFAGGEIQQPAARP
jgi:hypothetical protein